MPELFIIRHGQASFGADNYDVLSDLGQSQARAVGRALMRQGVTGADAWMTGTLQRQKDTLAGVAEAMGVTPAPILHPGLNEYDFTALLNARYGGAAPDEVHHDRKSHFRTLRDTVQMWQRDEIDNPPESWAAFEARVQDALETARALDARRVFLFSSGGAIAQMVRAVLGAPAATQVELQLQMKNCAVSRLIATPSKTFLHSFNETPHVTAETADLLSYA